MTGQQKRFLELCIIEQKKYSEIEVEMKLPRTTLSKWYDDLRNEREKIAKVRNLYLRKKITMPFREFYDWYNSHERKCDYCNITEEQIKVLLESERLHTKRIKTRGRSLELDRKEPELSYDTIDNLVLSCYWCNNAKTDTFTSQEFKEIGAAIQKVWEKRLTENYQVN